MSVRTGVLGVSIGFLLAGCSGTSRETPVPASAPAKVARYSVADLYKNAEFWARRFRRMARRSWSPRIARASGTPIRDPDGWRRPEPLTRSTTNSIFAASYFPGDDRILYSSDQGGNELTHLYVRNLDGTIRGPDARREAEGELRRLGGGRQVVLRLHQRARPALLRPLRGLDRRLQSHARSTRTPTGFDLGPVSRDKRYVALVKSRTTSTRTSSLSIGRRATTKNITAHTGDVSNSPADFSPDGTKLLFVSDGGREFASLRSYDLATGAQKAVSSTTGTSWAPPTRRAAST